MNWTDERIRATLSEMRRFGDDFTLVEVKEAAGGVPASLPETICAFANMPQGGTVFLGISQRKNFTVTGVDSPSDMIQAVTSQTRNAVTPAPQIEAYPVTVDGTSIVVVEVTALGATQKPALYKGRAYLRQADGDYQMNPNDLRMIEIDALHDSERIAYDMVAVPGTSIEDLDQTVLPQYLSSVRASSRRLRDVDDDDLLRLTSVITADGELTTAGLFALGFFPQGKIPSLAATAAVRMPRDGSGVRTRNRRDFDGPLPSLLEELQDWIEDNTGTDDIYRADGHMAQRSEFPLRAVREVVANALVHRDLGPETLGTGARIQVRLTPETLMIVNPGGLRGLSSSELESGLFRPKAVNQRLYEMAKHLTTADGANVIEGEGGGIREMLAETRDADLHRPKFIDRGVDFTVLLRRGPIFSGEDIRRLEMLAPGIRLSHIQKVLLLSLDNGEAWTIPKMCTEFSPLTRTEADSQLDSLRHQGLVTVTADGIMLASSPSGDGGPGAEGPVTEGTPEYRRPAPEAPPSDHAGDTTWLRRITKNGPAVYSALPTEETIDFHTLVSRVGMPDASVRYALSRLMGSGVVTMVGGQGHHATGYRRA